MDDNFLNRFRKSPRPEFAEALFRRINQPIKTNKNQLRFRLLTASVSVILLAVVLLFTSTQVRAFAQEIVRFFIPAQDNAFSLPSQDVSPTIVATPVLHEPALAGCEDAAASLSYRCAVGSAETILGFDIKELSSDPDGFSFVSASANTIQSSIILTYAREGGELVITEIQGVSPASVWEETWGAVPTASVEKVKIKDFDGEYVRGMFVVKSQTGTEAVWEPDAPVQRLRWLEGDMLLEIQMNGLPGDDEAIGKDWLISLAESLK